MDYPLAQPSAGAEPKTLPDRVVDHFVAQIFTGKLVPGERLPGDRDLAPLLGVDRTSLRVAMQQLARMGVLKVAHGSGVRVLDFREHAGMDFLAAVFALPQLSLGSAYLTLVLNDWLDLFPVVTGRALARATAGEILALDAMMEQQLELLARPGSLVEVAEREVAIEDRVLRMLGNTSMVLLGNSSRPVRVKLMVMFFETIDARKHVTAQRKMLADVVANAPVSADAVTQWFRAYLQKTTKPLRKHIQGLPLHPSLVNTKKPRRASKKTSSVAKPAPRR